MPRLKLTAEQKKLFLENQYGKSRKEVSNWFKEQLGIEVTESQIKDLRRHLGVVSGLTGRFGENGRKGSAVSYPLYSERWNGTQWLVKIGQPHVWIPKTRWIWEQHFGNIPKGKSVMFLDGNHNNFDINNLKLIDEFAVKIFGLKKLGDKNSELNKIGIAIAALEAKEIRGRKKCQIK